MGEYNFGLNLGIEPLKLDPQFTPTSPSLTLESPNSFNATLDGETIQLQQLPDAAIGSLSSKNALVNTQTPTAPTNLPNGTYTWTAGNKSYYARWDGNNWTGTKELVSGGDTATSTGASAGSDTTKIADTRLQELLKHVPADQREVFKQSWAAMQAKGQLDTATARQLQDVAYGNKSLKAIDLQIAKLTADMRHTEEDRAEAKSDRWMDRNIYKPLGAAIQLTDSIIRGIMAFKQAAFQFDMLQLQRDSARWNFELSKQTLETQERLATAAGRNARDIEEIRAQRDVAIERTRQREATRRNRDNGLRDLFFRRRSYSYGRAYA